jgi:hypothetical protein
MLFRLLYFMSAERTGLLSQKIPHSAAIGRHRVFRLRDKKISPANLLAF